MLNLSDVKLIECKETQTKVPVFASETEIATLADVKTFIAILGNSIIGWNGLHLDNDHHDYYMKSKSGEDIPLFSKEDAEYLNVLVDKCFQITNALSVDIHSVCIQIHDMFVEPQDKIESSLF